MKRIVTGLLIVVGVIHLLPLVGVAGPEKLSALYGIQIDEPNLAVLMRHRAVLFGLLGVFMCYAAFRPALQLLALIGGFISVGSFLGLAWATGDYNVLVGRVVVADIIALICLIAASVAYGLTRRPANLHDKTLKASFAELLKKIPGPMSEKWPMGERFVKVFSHGSMAVELYAPTGHGPQVPHEQDELYFVITGTAEFALEEKRMHLTAGDAVFVPAGAVHRFERFSKDFSTWAVFWGPHGGEE